MDSNVVDSSMIDLDRIDLDISDLEALEPEIKKMPIYRRSMTLTADLNPCIVMRLGMRRIIYRCS